MHAVVAEALHSVGAQQIDIRVGGRHAKRLPGGNFRHGSQVFIQRDQAVAAAHIQQQRGLAAARCGTLQRGTAKIIPRGLGAGAGVQHGNVGVKHRHDAALALPVQPQQHTPLLGRVDRTFGVGVGVHKIDRTAQLAIAGGQHPGGKFAAVGGKIHRDGGAVGLGHLPAVRLPHRGVIDAHLGGVAARLGHNGQRVIVGHGAEQDAAVKILGVERAGAAAHGQLVACAVVHGKAGTAHGQHRPRVGWLQAEDFRSVGRVDEHVLGPQLHKAPGQRLDLQRVGDAGGGGPAAVGAVNVQNGAVDGIAQQRQRRGERTGHDHDGHGQRGDNDSEEHPPPLLPLLVERC